MQTSTQPVAPSHGRTNLALATLFLGMFVLGSGELLVVGLLNLIAADLQVPIPTAGVLVTAYALGLAIGGPVLTASAPPRSAFLLRSPPGVWSVRSSWSSSSPWSRC